MSELKVNNSRLLWWVTLAADTLLAVFCMYACHAWIPHCASTQLPTYMGIAALCHLACAMCLPTEPLHPDTRFDQILKHSALKGLLILMAICTVLAMTNTGPLQRMLLASFCITFFLLSSLIGFVGIRLLARNNMIVVSLQEDNTHLHNMLSAANGITPQAVFAATATHIKDELYRPYSLQGIEEYLQANPQTETVVCFPAGENGSENQALIQLCDQYQVQLTLIPGFTMPQGVAMQAQRTGDSWQMMVRDMPLQNTGSQFLKRCFDIFFSLLFLLTLYPIAYLIICIIVKIQSPGPVYQTQKRYDMSGKKFKCHRFRCKHTSGGHDNPLFGFGRFLHRTGIYRMPEIFCVLKGEMSFVGPRPQTLAYNELYRSVAGRYLLRHTAKPGMTGWAEVNGINEESYETKRIEECVKQDIWYMQHWSMFLDICILFRRKSS